jgi:hypothetical protein
MAQTGASAIGAEIMPPNHCFFELTYKALIGREEMVRSDRGLIYRTPRLMNRGYPTTPTSLSENISNACCDRNRKPSFGFMSRHFSGNASLWSRHPLGMSHVSSASHPSNALHLIVLTLDGITTCRSALHAKNASAPISVMPCGRSISVSEEQCAHNAVGIFDTPAGIPSREMPVF